MFRLVGSIGWYIVELIGWLKWLIDVVDPNDWIDWADRLLRWGASSGGSVVGTCG